MMATMKPDARRRSDRIQFRLVYIATLPVFLITALLGRALPVRRGRRESGPGPTVLGRARAAASTCGTYALMG